MCVCIICKILTTVVRLFIRFGQYHHDNTRHQAHGLRTLRIESRLLIIRRPPSLIIIEPSNIRLKKFSNHRLTNNWPGNQHHQIADHQDTDIRHPHAHDHRKTEPSPWQSNATHTTDKMAIRRVSCEEKLRVLCCSVPRKPGKP